MAVTLKRRRDTVSYKEPSSDEGLSDSSDQERLSRKKRTAPSRRSTRHQHTEGGPSTETPHQDPPRRDAQTREEPKVLRKRGKRRISYKDVSSDEEDYSDADYGVEESSAVVERPRGRKPQSPRPQRNKKPRGRPRWTLGAPLRPKTSPQPASTTRLFPSDERIPAWASLPYHVLLQILVYASHPLHDEDMKPTSSIPWLAQMARLCSAFTKPALTALYRNPPIFAMKQTRKDLVHHLITPPSGAYQDYQVMVKRLELDATKMSALTDLTHSVTDLAALVKSLTTLKEIDIFDPIDRPPFRERLRHGRRWHYPDELFTALRDSELRLKSWRWVSTFCEHGPLWMKGIHSDKAFQSLREITLTKFHPDISRKPEDDQPTIEEYLGTALNVLPNLRTLTFETCGVVNGRLLPLLPNNLTSLNVTNCRDLISDALQGFLATHGTQLEELILNHNQSLDLSFLVDLKRSCPRLEILRMDLTYYSSLAMSADNEPLYDYLLGEDELPSWPSTLRVIDMEYLRNWNSAGAVTFFNSLIDSAHELPCLQELIILAMVNTDWRQRAEFRKKWSAKFKKVFSMPWEAPGAHLASLKAFRMWKTSQAPSIENNESTIEVTVKEKQKKEDSESESNAMIDPEQKKKREEKWNSKRLRSRAKSMAHYEESTENESNSDGSSDIGEEVKFVQGRCHTVVFRIDNFRPREDIYDEADFLDAEPSGDEDWNGNDDIDDEGGYAW